MDYNAESALKEKSLLDRESPFLLHLTLLGIPAAGSVALALLVQIPRFLYGESVPFFFAVEVGSLISAVVLLFVLRACLKLPLAPVGLYRNVLDFLAMARWHPAVKVALAGLVVLPQIWFFSKGNFWAIEMFQQMGRRALQNGDVHIVLDDVVIVCQLALTAGVPLLFALHMFSRWKPRSRVLPWLLLPLLFVGACIELMMMTILHF